MRRRDFISFLGGCAAAALPLAARAQQSGMPVIGFLGLGLGSSTSSGGAPPEFLRSLVQAGYVLGRNLGIEFRWANFYESLLPIQAVDLLRRQVAVIVTTGSPYAARAAKDTTSTIPIVFVIAEDPVKYELVASFNRPGGNVTGVTALSTELTGKRLNLLLEIVPGATRIGYLSVPGPVSEERDKALAAGHAVGREIIVSEVRNLRFEAAFGFLAEQQASGLLVGNYTLFSQERYRDKILELAARHKIPAIYPSRDYAANGGLMSYAARERDVWSQVADYTTRLLNGERADNLPVIQPTTFDFVINLKAAREQSLTVPPALLFAIADEVIE